MSNPGVIKLASNNNYNHHLWVDDNIGESIHIHYDQFRIEMSIQEFERTCDDVEKVVEELIEIEGFDFKEFDKRFLESIGNINGKIKKVTTKSYKLSELLVPDDDKICKLSECNRVKALSGIININETTPRNSNFYTQKNGDRLEKVSKFIQAKQYPDETGYIVVSKKEKIIIDGWHRAACLFFFYGDMEVDVKEFDIDERIISKNYFPIDIIPQKSRIILYGAGLNGRRLRNQIDDKYELVAWVDSNYEQLKNENRELTSVEDGLNKKFDYILITIMNEDISKEIRKTLVEEKGINESIIVSV